MQVALSVKRFNPDNPSVAPRWQNYTIEMDGAGTVLDALIVVREEHDETLTLRCSCRSAICGSCAMRINGEATLACKAKISDAAKGGRVIRVEPMGNMPVVKDLVTDITLHWDKVSAVTPWIKPELPEPATEYVAPNEDMVRLVGAMGCILCGACVSDCTALEVDPNFLGPAALAKAYRVVTDPRDTDTDNRLGQLEKYGGIWDCTRCMACVQVCPKGVAPMDKIMVLRDIAMQRGFNKTPGSRHTTGFTELVEHSGRLDEFRLPVMSVGAMNIKGLMGLAPIGLKSLVRGKLPPIFHKAIPGVGHVHNIAKEVDEVREHEAAHSPLKVSVR